MPTATPENDKWAERIARKAEAKSEEQLIDRLLQASIGLMPGAEGFASTSHYEIATHRNRVAAIRAALEASK